MEKGRWGAEVGWRRGGGYRKYHFGASQLGFVVCINNLNGFW